MPEWLVIVAVLGFFSLLGLEWRPFCWRFLFSILAVSLPVAHAVSCASRLPFLHFPAAQRRRLKALTAFLHLMQPMARLIGRIKLGLTPWRRCGFASGVALPLPWPKTFTIWSQSGARRLPGSNR